MSTIQSVLGGAAAKATGWALVHVLWQATLIAGLLGLALYALRNRSANARYVAACIALCLTIALPVATGITSFDTVPSTPLLPAVQPQVTTPPDIGVAEAATPLQPLSLVERISNLPVEPMLPWVVAIWLVGVTFLSARVAFGLTSVSRMGRLGISPVPPSVERAMREIAETMGLQRTIRILRSRRIEVPTVIGWLQPVILVPASALSGLSPHQLQTILAHELAHIRRHDFAVNLAQTAVETLLFFHPAVWWISRQVRVEREHCCDDVAVALCGDPIDYARALATMEELRGDLLPMVAASGGSLSARIRRLLGIRADETEAVRPAIAVTAALAVTMAAVLPLFAGSYIYESVTASAPGERIVVIGDADEDLDVVVDSIIDAQLVAAAARENVQRLKETELARLESMREDIERATEIAASLKEGRLADLERVRAELETSGVVEIAAAASAVARAELEAARVAEVFADYAFEIAPLAPAPPTPPAPAVSPAPPAPPAPPVPPAPAIAPIAATFSSVAGVPVILDISTRRGAAHVRTSNDDKPLDPDNPTVDDLIFLKSYDIDAKYIQEMKAAGLKDLTARELAILSSYKVTPSTVKELRAVFGNDLSAARIGAMASLGIDTAWAREMKATGMDMSASDAIRMKSLGLDPASVRSMKSQFGNSITPSEAVRLRSVGVDGDYVAALASVGLDDLTPAQLVRLRSVGVDASYVKEIRSSGLTGLDVEDYVRFRSVGVEAGYVASMRSSGLKGLTASDIVRMASLGVDPDYVREMKSSGLVELDAEDLLRLKSIGVDSAYASEIRGAGYPDITSNDLARLKSMGIDGSYIRTMNSSRSEKLSVRDLIRLKSAGINADYLKNWNERK